MAVELYDEHEQSERVRGWLRENGASLLIGVGLALAGIFGWRQWISYQDSRDLLASEYYTAIQLELDEDRLSAKALMHLAIIDCEGDFTAEPFLAACALAWRDEPDEDGLIAELLEADPDKVSSAALAMYAGAAPTIIERLRTVLEETREWSDAQGVEHGQGLLMRTAVVLDQLEP